MGRRPHPDNHRRVNVYIAEAVLAELQIFYFDPARGRAKYGAISDVVNVALKEHLERVKNEGKKDEADKPTEEEGKNSQHSKARDRRAANRRATA